MTEWKLDRQSGNVPINSGRGLYQWRYQNFAPVDMPVVYERFKWSELENSAGIHLSPLITKFNAAVASGKRFAFRIQALVNREGRSVPPNIPGQTLSDGTFVPDWNNPVFLSRLSLLFEAIAKVCNNPKTAFMDIGVYGNWGEWHMYGINSFIATLDTLKKIIDLHVRNFPAVQLVQMTDHSEALLYALKLPTEKPIGMRRDSFGNTHFAKIKANVEVWKLASERWKVAPFVVETWGSNVDFGLCQQQAAEYHISGIANGNIGISWVNAGTTKQQQWLETAKIAGFNFHLDTVVHDPIHKTLTSSWANTGNAPTYDRWIVIFELLKNGVTVETLQSTVDLRKLLPGESHVVVDSAVFMDLPAGTYDFRVTIPPLFYGGKPLTLATPMNGVIGALTVAPVDVQSLYEKTLAELEALKVIHANLQATHVQTQTDLAASQQALETVKLDLRTCENERQLLINKNRSFIASLTELMKSLPV